MGQQPSRPFNQMFSHFVICPHILKALFVYINSNENILETCELFPYVPALAHLASPRASRGFRASRPTAACDTGGA